MQDDGNFAMIVPVIPTAFGRDVTYSKSKYISSLVEWYCYEPNFPKYYRVTHLVNENLLLTYT